LHSVDLELSCLYSRSLRSVWTCGSVCCCYAVWVMLV